VGFIGDIDIDSTECLTYVGVALVFDLALILVLFIRLLIQGGSWDVENTLAFYDAAVISVLLVYFLLTIVGMNEETQGTHLQILEAQRYKFALHRMDLREERRPPKLESSESSTRRFGGGPDSAISINTDVSTALKKFYSRKASADKRPVIPPPVRKFRNEIVRTDLAPHSNTMLGLVSSEKGYGVGSSSTIEEGDEAKETKGEGGGAGVAAAAGGGGDAKVMSYDDKPVDAAFDTGGDEAAIDWHTAQIKDAAVLLESAIAELRTLDKPYTILWLTVDKALVVKILTAVAAGAGPSLYKVITS